MVAVAEAVAVALVVFRMAEAVRLAAVVVDLSSEDHAPATRSAMTTKRGAVSS